MFRCRSIRHERTNCRQPRLCRLTQDIGEGVWYIASSVRHASVAIEFPDFVTVVEAPLSEERSIAVINEVHRLVRISRPLPGEHSLSF